MGALGLCDRGAIFFDLSDISSSFPTQVFHHVGRRAIQELFAFELAIDIYDQLFQLVGLFSQALPLDFAVHVAL